jgi:hypothetical protein
MLSWAASATAGTPGGAHAGEVQAARVSARVIDASHVTSCRTRQALIASVGRRLPCGTSLVPNRSRRSRPWSTDPTKCSGQPEPVGPTDAVCGSTGGTVCGVGTDTLQVLDEDWEAACFVEKCPDCFAAVAAHD